MAQNPIPENLDELITMAEDAADGLQQLEVTVGIKQNTEAATRLDLGSLVTGTATYDTLVAQGKVLVAAATVARSNARAFCMAVRDRLKQFLGTKPSDAWQAAGWSAQSIAVPATGEKLLPLLGSIQSYLTAHPTHEDSSAVNLTAARAGTLHAALSDARSAVNAHAQAEGESKNARDAAAEKLQVRLRGLVNELAGLLGPLDPAWRTFGFNPPGAPDRPDVVKNTEATALGGGQVRVQGAAAARAEYYQVHQFIVGTDVAYGLTESPPGPDVILAGRPVGATIKYKMRAVNETGAGPFGNEVTVTVS
ncbi:MAG: hypothetical protein PCFJNLEI_01930 [Verrucomicrobiae bacterium]|nr:hypothetical protein [Verrucomicrobiae bacterium]